MRHGYCVKEIQWSSLGEKTVYREGTKPPLRTDQKYNSTLETLVFSVLLAQTHFW